MIVREGKVGDVDIYVCKYSRRRGYVGCPLKYKITFHSSTNIVTVDCNMANIAHDHSLKEGEINADGNLFRWNKKQEDIIKDGVKNHAIAKVIYRNLLDANAFDGVIPSKLQLYNKIASIKKKLYKSQNIVNTHDLRQRVCQHDKIPEDELEGYVCYSYIDDENEENDPRFTIIFSTKKNIGKLRSDRILQTDATYRLNWLGYPVFVLGNVIVYFITFHTLHLMSRLIVYSIKSLRTFCASISILLNM